MGTVDLIVGARNMPFCGISIACMGIVGVSIDVPTILLCGAGVGLSHSGGRGSNTGRGPSSVGHDGAGVGESIVKGQHASVQPSGTFLNPAWQTLVQVVAPGGG